MSAVPLLAGGMPSGVDAACAASSSSEPSSVPIRKLIEAVCASLKTISAPSRLIVCVQPSGVVTTKAGSPASGRRRFSARAGAAAAMVADRIAIAARVPVFMSLLPVASVDVDVVEDALHVLAVVGADVLDGDDGTRCDVSGIGLGGDQVDIDILTRTVGHGGVECIAVEAGQRLLAGGLRLGGGCRRERLDRQIRGGAVPRRHRQRKARRM